MPLPTSRISDAMNNQVPANNKREVNDVKGFSLFYDHPVVVIETSVQPFLKTRTLLVQLWLSQ